MGLNNYLDEIGKKYKFSFYAFSASSCTFIQREGQKNCVELQKIVDEAIRKNKIIILSYAYDQHFNFLMQNLIAFIDDMNIDNDKKIILFEDVPGVNPTVLEANFKKYLRGQKIDNINFLRDKEKNDTINAKIKLLTTNKAIFFNPLEGLTEKHKKDWPIYNGLIAYFDYGHLNEYVTRQWAQEVLPKQKAFWEQIAKEANEQDVSKK